MRLSIRPSRFKGKWELVNVVHKDFAEDGSQKISKIYCIRHGDTF